MLPADSECLYSFKSTPSQPLTQVFTLDCSTFTFCPQCRHFHCTSDPKERTRKTEQTESVQIRESNILDMQAKINVLLKESAVSYFRSEVGLPIFSAKE